MCVLQGLIVSLSGQGVTKQARCFDIRDTQKVSYMVSLLA